VIDVSKLKIGNIDDDKPVTMTIKMPAAVHQDLIAYASLLKRDDGQAIDPNSLVATMLKRFMASDRAFKKMRRQALQEKE
jgi:hypothetical protein